jgi:hypothetical protein
MISPSVALAFALLLMIGRLSVATPTRREMKAYPCVRCPKTNGIVRDEVTELRRKETANQREVKHSGTRSRPAGRAQTERGLVDG